jgi:hypothetical protein
MPHRKSFILLLIIMLRSGSYSPAAKSSGMLKMQNRATKHIVLQGASIGKIWKIDELPVRVGNSRYLFEYAGQFSPDKSKKLTEAIERLLIPTLDQTQPHFCSLSGPFILLQPAP